MVKVKVKGPYGSISVARPGKGGGKAVVKPRGDADSKEKGDADSKEKRDADSKEKGDADSKEKEDADSKEKGDADSRENTEKGVSDDEAKEKNTAEAGHVDVRESEAGFNDGGTAQARDDNIDNEGGSDPSSSDSSEGEE